MEIKTSYKEQIKSPYELVAVIDALLKARPEDEQHKEYFYSFGLDGQNKIIYVCLEAFGTVNYCCPIVREILRNAIVKNAVSIIVSHNHPAGEVIPSNEDRIFTRKLIEACNHVGVKMLDHLIIGDKKYHSFADKGEL